MYIYIFINPYINSARTSSSSGSVCPLRREGWMAVRRGAPRSYQYLKRALRALIGCLEVLQTVFYKYLRCK